VVTALAHHPDKEGAIVPTMPELVVRDLIHPTWFWICEVTDQGSPYEVWDLVLVRTLNKASVTGGDIRRTLYISGIPGDPEDARRHHAGTAQAPGDLCAVLAGLLKDASNIDCCSNFQSWAREIRKVNLDDTVAMADFLRLQQTYKRDRVRRDALRGWLDVHYAEYIAAAQAYLNKP
jgi:hypothetical protein